MLHSVAPRRVDLLRRRRLCALLLQHRHGQTGENADGTTLLADTDQRVQKYHSTVYGAASVREIFTQVLMVRGYPAGCKQTE